MSNKDDVQKSFAAYRDWLDIKVESVDEGSAFVAAAILTLAEKVDQLIDMISATAK